MADAKTPTTLEDNRIIYMSGDFNEEKAKDIITKLFTLEAKDPSKDILMYIDSYGGYVHSFLAMHDVIKMLRCDVATVALGKSMSCGQMLLVSGTKGKRFMTPNARVLMHEIASWTFGKVTDMEVDLNETKALKKLCEDLIMKYTKIKKTELKEMMSIDSYFNAQEALKYGMIDYIINKPKDLYSHISL